MSTASTPARDAHGSNEGFRIRRADTTAASRAFRHQDGTTVDATDYDYWVSRGRKLQAQAVACAGARVRDALWCATKTAVAAVRRWHLRRITVHSLRELSDHALRDIGLHRSEIQWVARACSYGDARPHIRTYAASGDPPEPATVPSVRRAA